jgi:hypothetical protein
LRSGGEGLPCATMIKLFFSRSNASSAVVLLALGVATAAAGFATSGCGLGGCDPVIETLPNGGSGGSGGSTSTGLGGGDGTGGAAAVDTDGGACASFMGDAGPRTPQNSPGCTASAPGMSCGPSGCSSLCPSADYQMTCTSTDPSDPIPEPPASAECKIIPIPTPSDVLFYCCACDPQP